MVESNKILTVSYGTFSCTLEGFDDAFETMKAIAEYFRDLAAEDRFFGAEPPTPDAEMLARLAERSSARRIEARSSDTGIVLRQSAEAPAAAPVGAAAAASAAAAPSAEIAEAPAEEIAEAVVADDMITETATDEVAADEVAEDEADDAALIAAIAASSEISEDTQDEAEEAEIASLEEALFADEAEDEDEAEIDEVEAYDDEDADEEAFEDEAYDDEFEDEAEFEEDTAFEDEAEEDWEDAAEDVADDVTAEEESEVVLAEDESVEVETAEVEMMEAISEPQADDNSIVAKLRRIRAVVSRTRATAAPVDFSEDQHADEMVEETGVDLTPLHAATTTPVMDETLGFDDEFSEEDYAEDGYADEGYADEDDYAEDDFAEEDELAEEDVADAEPAPVVAPRPVVAARVVKVKRSDFEQAMGLEDAAPKSSLSPEDEADLQSELAALEAEIEADADYDEDEDFEEVEAELADDELEWDEDETAAEFFEDDELDEFGPEAAVGVADDSLTYDEDDFEDEEAYSDEAVEDAEDEAAFDEAEVTAEDEDSFEEEAFEDEDEDEDEAYEDDSAELDDEDALEDESDDAYMDDEDDVAAEAEPVPAPVAPAALAGRDKLAKSASTDDMDRILAETNSQLGETEGTRRRSAIAHLRAAVAATKAEKDAGSDLRKSDEDSADAYRQDLAQVVRPRRPRPSGTPLRRTEDKPAPLRLVAEQRVDIENEFREPVRPRRVSIADLIRQEAEADVEADAPEAAGEGYEGLQKSEPSGFVEFLEDSDATELNEVLECAAAYLAFVEGREQFSRPQLMNRVREADPEGYTREDALRAFGMLLREGKIRKVKGGRFTASDRIGYRPDRRQAV